MLETFLNAITKILFETVAAVIIQHFKLENGVELVTCTVGLACILLGALDAWFGWL